ncbi:hypothetical protein [Gloeobacter morelensis]|uniref:Uncharacterized protein n=1 Tax=Gloeobacter morelensis MG652769 TaxID=2781736 RepID=A0ABY3PHK3_9CYAN|nr:hypothetical protein [Gloeobacter morelensis]UFP93027.1 hypothetical protein ISF26_14545 [Gloeobacter morelensis MG652769]
MFGTFQQSTVRVQVAANGAILKRCLTEFALLRRWAWTQRYPDSLPTVIDAGLEFDSYAGPVKLSHKVGALTDNRLEMVLWDGVDGYSRWLWGDGWVQSTIEGVSLLPLALGQTILLDSLARFATALETEQTQQPA